MKDRQFERLELLIGKKNLLKIKNIKILVLGIGGVGSYVVESLVRNGISNIIIVDFDKIDITNLNRQVMTNLNNVGELKTKVIEERILSINKNCHIKIINEFINEENISDLFKENIDYLIDCCDYLPTKKLIIKNCIEKNINFIICCGTGNKFDIKKLEITTLDKTSYDPIAKILRKYVKENKIKEKIICCCSKEVPQKIDSKIIGSNSYVPSAAGLLITSYVINSIIKDN